MRTRDNVLVGVVLAIGLVALAVGTLYLARGGLQTGYPLYVRLPWGSGIKQGQTVYLSGVDVGFVGDVDLRQDGTLIVTLRINKQYRVPEGTTATIEPNGIFGDVDVALRPIRPTASYIAHGDTVPAGKPAPGIAELMARADSASGRLDDVARAVQVELVQGGGVADLRKTLEGANNLVVQLAKIASDQSQQLNQAMHSLNRAASAIDSASVDSTVKNLKSTTAHMSELSDNLEHATHRLDAILVKVDSGTGTAGKFINDPGLYNELNALVSRLDSLATDLHRNPKRYLPPVHVF
jgi:phospholipid/cholesterol/gamma-HCH transport system substrate-binding protein